MNQYDDPKKVAHWCKWLAPAGWLIKVKRLRPRRAKGFREGVSAGMLEIHIFDVDCRSDNPEFPGIAVA